MVITDWRQINGLTSKASLQLARRMTDEDKEAVLKTQQGF